MLKKFVKYYKPHMKLFLLDLFCAFVVALINLIYPFLAQMILNNEHLNQNYMVILYIGILLFVIYVLKAFLNFIIQYWGHKVGVLIQSDMRRDLFSKFEKLPFSYFDNNKVGTLMSRIINDLMDISEMAHHAPEDVFLSLITLIGSFIMMVLTVNYKLALIVFIVVPLIVFYASYRKRKMSRASRNMRIEVGKINASVENSLSGIRVTKAYVNDEYEKNKFENSLIGFQNARMKSYKQMGLFFSGMNFFTDFMYFLALITGGIFYAFNIDGFSHPQYTAYILYITMMINPIRTLTNIFDQIQNGMTGFERFQEIMDEKEEFQNYNGKEFVGLNNKIEFRNVSFNYENKEEKEVLNNLNFVIEKGKTTALVGPSGGGKTTICNIIPRFYIQDSGNVFFDDIDSSEFILSSLRKK